MIQGIVTPDREAVIKLRLRGPGGQEEEVAACIDTGFNDYLTVPQALISRLGLTFAAPTYALLGDGSRVQMDYYLVTVLWDGQPHQVLALEADGGVLVGMSLCYGSRIVLDVIDGGPVSIGDIP